jgi:uncharacterized protein (TIGR02594 family)
MADLPAQYAWLKTSMAENQGHPLMVAEALRQFGVHEIAGAASNPIILGWAKEIAAMPGKDSVAGYKDDDTAWCGLFMAHVAHTTGKPFPDEPLWALNWAAFGTASPQPSLGDVLVFNRFDKTGKLIGGHVGLYVAEDGDAYHVLGGNESDQVEITRVAKNRLKAARRPAYPVGVPANVKPVVVSAGGTLSQNEA